MTQGTKNAFAMVPQSDSNPKTNRTTLLLPEQTTHADGVGPAVDISADSARLLVLTLAINRTSEREQLAVSIWGSSDCKDWGDRPLLSLPYKFYCGMYSFLLNLAQHPEVRYLRVQWKIDQWSPSRDGPVFTFSVFVERSARGCDKTGRTPRR